MDKNLTKWTIWTKTIISYAIIYMIYIYILEFLMQINKNAWYQRLYLKKKYTQSVEHFRLIKGLYKM